jgi:uncharacterized protein YbaR (Trm112 family)
MAELNEALLAVLACPNCHASLIVDVGAAELVCADSAACGLAYPVRNGIPILLVDEARRPDGTEGASTTAEA